MAHDAESPLRVLIVDDSTFMRNTIRRIVESDPSLRVAGEARNGEEAVRQARDLKPDVITLDVEMPKVDGLEALRRIMAEMPTNVIMCSAMTCQGSSEAIEALRLGAADFVTKDASHISLSVEAILRDDLLRKIRVVGRRQAVRSVKAAAQRTLSKAWVGQLGRPEIVLIGASTGGPLVLETMLRALPESMKQPVVVAQHMPAIFTESLAHRLDELCAVTVVHATRSGPLRPGAAHIIQGGKHGRIIVSAGGRFGLEISDEPAQAPFKPSVDELFTSAAKQAGGGCLGVILTGMGEDGLLGARALAAVGAPILAQSAESCVVYGMPKRVVEESLSLADLPPDLIAATLSRALSSPGGADAARRLAS